MQSSTELLMQPNQRAQQARSMPGKSERDQADMIEHHGMSETVSKGVGGPSGETQNEQDRKLSMYKTL